MVQLGSRPIAEELAARTDVQLFKMLLEYRDRETALHSIRVAEYATEIAMRLVRDEALIVRIGQAALLHDVGKLAVPDGILLKPHGLNAQERALVKSHAPLGGALVALQPDLRNVAPLVRHHHERYDGSGYPDGLCAKAIPLGARIICVADAFDAMISDRPYHDAITVEDAKEELRRNAGTQFDPEIVREFVAFF